MDFPKPIKDNVYILLQEPTLERLRQYLQSNTGEHNPVDFKGQWISGGKLAKEMISIANYGGGIIIFGVYENEDKSHDPKGLDALRDKAEVANDIKKYISDHLKYEIYDFEYNSAEYEPLKGKKFQMLVVEDTPEFLPLLPKSDSDSIKKNQIYIRRGTSCEIANEAEIEQIIHRRINYTYPQTGKPLDLTEHLKQLQILYSKISPTIQRRVDDNDSNSWETVVSAFVTLLSQAREAFGGHYETIPNPLYPEETYEEFIAQMIFEKKNKIKRVLDLR